MFPVGIKIAATCCRDLFPLERISFHLNRVDLVTAIDFKGNLKVLLLRDHDVWFRLVDQSQLRPYIPINVSIERAVI